MLKELTEQVAERKDLTAPQVQQAVKELVEEQVPAHVKALFLTRLAEKGETTEEIGAFAAELRNRSVRPPLDPSLRNNEILDVCGTGGLSLNSLGMTTLIPRKVATAISKQIGMECFASMQYEAIAGWFKLEGLPRLSAHFSTQAAEERDHAHRFMKFLQDTGTLAQLPAIPAPQCDFKSAVEAVQVALDHELKVTDAIKSLFDLADREGDRFTQNSLQWFIQEQLEEVSSTEELLQIVKRAGTGGLLIVEHFLASRGGKPDA